MGLPIKLRCRVKYAGKHHSRINKKILGKSIKLSPASVEKRVEFGHWKGDLIKAKRVETEPALMTYFENSFLKESHSKTFPLLMFKKFNTHLITGVSIKLETAFARV